MNDQEIISTRKMRGDCYRLFASCFYLPQKELFHKEGLFDNLTSALKPICPSAAVFSSRMGEALSMYSDEELSVEFAKLFVGPFELKAPPYGSVYIDKDRRVMGDSTLEIVKIYQESGLIIRDDFKELPDHIAVELEFMYYLIFKEEEFLEKSQHDRAIDFLKKQGIFLNQFLGQWISPFCEKICEGTDNGFYRSLGECVLNFVTNDRGYINLLLEGSFSQSEKDL